MLRKQAREHYEQDWLAPAGSAQEKQLLKRWKRRKLTPEDMHYIDMWLKDPEGIKKGRGFLFVHAAKKRVLGEVIFEMATERQNRLSDKEWLVAYFTAHCLGQKQIARKIQLSERSIDDIITKIKIMITQDFGCDIEFVGLPLIARWFFGL